MMEKRVETTRENGTETVTILVSMGIRVFFYHVAVRHGMLNSKHVRAAIVAFISPC